MKTVERIIVKIIIIQFLFLVVIQAFLSYDNPIVPLTKLAQYEGVTNNNYTKILETFEGVLE